MNLLVESRRLMGPNLYSTSMGVALEVRPEPDVDARVVQAWVHYARALSRAIGWPEPEIHVRPRRDATTLYFSVPADVLMTGTEVAEAAWVLASTRHRGALDAATVARLNELAAAERMEHSSLASVYAAAVARGVCATFDDEILTLGSGAGARSWPLGAIPVARDITWDEISDARIALVTGSNGKTTTTRLVAAMCRASGRSPGWCCSDGVWVGGEQVEYGDFSGPVGARTVLRSKDVDVAILESARGGMLRRGLAVSRADAAIITNIAADHFGEYGIESLEDLTAAKRIVERVLANDSWLVLNADDPRLAAVAATSSARVALYAASKQNVTVAAHVAGGGDAAIVRDGRVALHRDRTWHDLGEVNDMPLTMHGAAPHNIENILGAALLATVLGTSVEAVRSTLATFGASNRDNPGRLQRYAFGGVDVLVDYAHNPDGLAALCETARSISATRRLLLLGQAGNRDDEEIRDLVRVAMRAIPFDHVIIKEELKLLRGRSEGDVPRLLADELDRLGVPATSVEITRDELAAMQRAFAWARAGDLIVCPIHVDKADVLAWLGRVGEAAWKPGMRVPP
jgi:UDP-N-acetylmuramyl tripeptide synthase